MEFEMKVNTGGEGGGEYEKPEGPGVMDDSLSVVHVRISAEHMRKIKSLPPGTKVSLTVRGSVQSFEQKAQEGYGAPVGELCIYAPELSVSRGSEYDELLEED